ncbi:MAG: hypothetical protein DI536_18805 [Archangium gephyra]|uniref:Uncharacterized protein n=1 Tax=Archangium gephyra TaxID=48 RepID=A0A2W5TC58_9BACT|nr:MAG: hypothetical protein DI536_18805 [Archangium gephyra]
MTDWRAKLEARWPGVSFAPLELADALVGEDLLLAKAVSNGDARALSYLDAIVATEVRRAVTPLGASIDDVMQQVRERLRVAGRLRDYAGQGTLSAWVRAMAVRLALNSKRPGAREEAVAELPDAAMIEPDPELALLRARYRESFRAAFSEAIAALTPRDRTILRMNAIGKMYGKDASTISRWLASSREALLSHTRQTLGAGCRSRRRPSTA